MCSPRRLWSACVGCGGSPTRMFPFNNSKSFNYKVQLQCISYVIIIN